MPLLVLRLLQGRTSLCVERCFVSSYKVAVRPGFLHHLCKMVLVMRCSCGEGGRTLSWVHVLGPAEYRTCKSKHAHPCAIRTCVHMLQTICSIHTSKQFFSPIKWKPGSLSCLGCNIPILSRRRQPRSHMEFSLNTLHVYSGESKDLPPVKVNF